MLSKIKLLLSKTWNGWKENYESRRNSNKILLLVDQEKLDQLKSVMQLTNEYFDNLNNPKRLHSNSQQSSNEQFNTSDLTLCIQLTVISIDYISQLFMKSSECGDIIEPLLSLIHHLNQIVTLSELKSNSITNAYDEIINLYHIFVSVGLPEESNVTSFGLSSLNVKTQQVQLYGGFRCAIPTNIIVCMTLCYYNIIHILSKLHTNPKKQFIGFCTKVLPSSLLITEILFRIKDTSYSFEVSNSANTTNLNISSNKFTQNNLLDNTSNLNEKLFVLIGHLWNVCLFPDVKSLEYLANIELSNIYMRSTPSTSTSDHPDPSHTNKLTSDGTIDTYKIFDRHSKNRHHVNHNAAKNDNNINVTTYFDVFYETLSSTLDVLSKSFPTTVGENNKSLRGYNNSIYYLLCIYSQANKKFTKHNDSLSVPNDTINVSTTNTNESNTTTANGSLTSQYVASNSSVDKYLPIKLYERVLKFSFQLLSICQNFVRHNECSQIQLMLDLQPGSQSSSLNKSSQQKKQKLADGLKDIDVNSMSIELQLLQLQKEIWLCRVKNSIFYNLQTEFPFSIPYDKSLVISQLKLRDCSRDSIVRVYSNINEQIDNISSKDDALYSKKVYFSSVISALEFHSLCLLIKIDHRCVLLLNDKRHKHKIKSLFKVKDTNASTTVLDNSNTINTSQAQDASAVDVIEVEPTLNNETYSVATVASANIIYVDEDNDDDDRSVHTSTSNHSSSTTAALTNNPLLKLMCGLIHTTVIPSNSNDLVDTDENSKVDSMSLQILTESKEDLLCLIIETLAKLHRLSDLFKYILKSTSILQSFTSAIIKTVKTAKPDYKLNEVFHTNILYSHSVQKKLISAFSGLQIIQYSPILKVFNDCFYVSHKLVNMNLSPLLQAMTIASQQSTFPVNLNVNLLHPLFTKLVHQPLRGTHGDYDNVTITQMTSHNSTTDTENEYNHIQEVKYKHEMLICLYFFLTQSISLSYGESSNNDDVEDSCVSGHDNTAQTTAEGVEKDKLQSGSDADESIATVTATNPEDMSIDSEGNNTHAIRDEFKDNSILASCDAFTFTSMQLWSQIVTTSYSQICHVLQTLKTIPNENSNTKETPIQLSKSRRKHNIDDKTVDNQCMNLDIDARLDYAYLGMSILAFLMNAVSCGCLFDITSISSSLSILSSDFNSISATADATADSSNHNNCNGGSYINLNQCGKQFFILRHLDIFTMDILQSLLRYIDISAANDDISESKIDESVKILLFVLKTMNVWDRIVTTSNFYTEPSSSINNIVDVNISHDGNDSETKIFHEKVFTVFKLLNYKLPYLFINSMSQLKANDSNTESNNSASLHEILSMVSSLSFSSIKCLDHDLIHSSLSTTLLFALNRLRQFYDTTPILQPLNSKAAKNHHPISLEIKVVLNILSCLPLDFLLSSTSPLLSTRARERLKYFGSTSEFDKEYKQYMTLQHKLHFPTINTATSTVAVTSNITQDSQIESMIQSLLSILDHILDYFVTFSTSLADQMVMSAEQLCMVEDQVAIFHQIIYILTLFLSSQTSQLAYVGCLNDLLLYDVYVDSTTAEIYKDITDTMDDDTSATNKDNHSDIVIPNKRRTRSEKNSINQQISGNDISHNNNSNNNINSNSSNAKVKFHLLGVWKAYQKSIIYVIQKQTVIWRVISYFASITNNSSQYFSEVFQREVRSLTISLKNLYSIGVSACFQPWTLVQLSLTDIINNNDADDNNKNNGVSDTTDNKKSKRMNTKVAPTTCYNPLTLESTAHKLIAVFFEEFINLFISNIAKDDIFQLQFFLNIYKKLSDIVISSNKTINLLNTSTKYHIFEEIASIKSQYVSKIEDNYVSLYDLILYHSTSVYKFCAEYILASSPTNVTVTVGSASYFIWYILSDSASIMEHLRTFLSIPKSRYYINFKLRQLLEILHTNAFGTSINTTNNATTTTNAAKQNQHMKNRKTLTSEPVLDLDFASILSVHIINKNILTFLFQQFKHINSACTNHNANTNNTNQHIIYSSHFNIVRGWLYYLSNLFSFSRNQCHIPCILKTATSTSWNNNSCASDDMNVPTKILIESADDSSLIPPVTEEIKQLLNTFRSIFSLFMKLYANRLATSIQKHSDSSDSKELEGHSNESTSIHMNNDNEWMMSMNHKHTLSSAIDDHLISDCFMGLFRTYLTSAKLFPLFAIFFESLGSSPLSGVTDNNSHDSRCTASINNWIYELLQIKLCFLVIQAYIHTTTPTAAFNNKNNPSQFYDKSCDVEQVDTETRANHLLTEEDNGISGNWICDTDVVTSVCKMLSHTMQRLISVGLSYHNSTFANQMSVNDIQNNTILQLFFHCTKMSTLIYKYMLQKYDFTLKIDLLATETVNANIADIHDKASDYNSHHNKQKPNKRKRLSQSKNSPKMFQFLINNRDKIRDCLSICCQSFYRVTSNLMFAWTPLFITNVSHTYSRANVSTGSAENDIYAALWCLKMMNMIVPSCELICQQTLPWLSTSIGSTCSLIAHFLTIAILQSNSQNSNAYFYTQYNSSRNIGQQYQRDRSTDLQLLYQYLARWIKVTADNHETTKHAPFILTHIIQFLANRSFEKLSPFIKTSSIDNSAGNYYSSDNNNENYADYIHITYNGLFALLDKCRHRQRKQIYELLNHTGRSLYDEINSIYQRDYKFGSNTDSN